MTCPYTSEQNADLESSWRTIQQLTRSNLKRSGLPKSFWNHAATYAATQLNCWPTRISYLLITSPTQLLSPLNPAQPTPIPTPCNAINPTVSEVNWKQTYLTHFEAFTGIPPRIELLLPFGCKVHVHTIPKKRRDKKLSYRSDVGVFLGLSRKRKGFKVYLPSSAEIVTSRNVTPLPEDFSLSPQIKEEYDNLEQDNGDPPDYFPEEEEENAHSSSFLYGKGHPGSQI